MFRLWIFVLLSITSNADVSAQRKESSSRDSGSLPEQVYDIDDYLAGVCSGSYNWKEPTRPCEVKAAIEYQCVMGLKRDIDTGPYEQVLPQCWELQDCQSPDFQRTCYCQSQYRDSVIGCYYCALSHSGGSSGHLNGFD
jgi:hypothetical protein